MMQLYNSTMALPLPSCNNVYQYVYIYIYIYQHPWKLHEQSSSKQWLIEINFNTDRYDLFTYNQCLLVWMCIFIWNRWTMRLLWNIYLHSIRFFTATSLNYTYISSLAIQGEIVPYQMWVFVFLDSALILRTNQRFS